MGEPHPYKNHGIPLPFGKEEFDILLKQTHAIRGTAPQPQVPTLGHKEIELYQLYGFVCEEGGWSQICKNRSWKKIVTRYAFMKTCTNGTYAIKQIYVRNLLCFEKRFYCNHVPPHIDTIPQGLRKTFNQYYENAEDIKNSSATDQMPKGNGSKYLQQNGSTPIDPSRSLASKYATPSAPTSLPLKPYSYMNSQIRPNFPLSENFRATQTNSQSSLTGEKQLGIYAPLVMYDDYRKLHYMGQVGCLQKLLYSLTCDLDNERDWALNFLLVISNESEPQCQLNLDSFPGLLEVLLHHAVFYDDLPLVSDKAPYVENIFEFGDGQDKAVYDQRLNVICSIIFSLSKTPLNVIPIAYSKRCLVFLLRCISDDRIEPKTQEFAFNILINVCPVLSIKSLESDQTDDVLLSSLIDNVVSSPFRSTLHSSLWALSNLCKCIDNLNWLSEPASLKYFSSEFYQKVFQLLSNPDLELLLTGLEMLYHLTLLSSLHCQALLSNENSTLKPLSYLSSLLTFDSFAHGQECFEIEERPLHSDYQLYKKYRQKEEGKRKLTREREQVSLKCEQRQQEVRSTVLASFRNLGTQATPPAAATTNGNYNSISSSSSSSTNTNTAASRKNSVGYGHPTGYGPNSHNYSNHMTNRSEGKKPIPYHNNHNTHPTTTSTSNAHTSNVHLARYPSNASTPQNTSALSASHSTSTSSTLTASSLNTVSASHANVAKATRLPSPLSSSSSSLAKSTSTSTSPLDTAHGNAHVRAATDINTSSSSTTPTTITTTTTTTTTATATSSYGRQTITPTSSSISHPKSTLITTSISSNTTTKPPIVTSTTSTIQPPPPLPPPLTAAAIALANNLIPSLSRRNSLIDNDNNNSSNNDNFSSSNSNTSNISNISNNNNNLYVKGSSAHNTYENASNIPNHHNYSNYPNHYVKANVTSSFDSSPSIPSSSSNFNSNSLEDPSAPPSKRFKYSKTYTSRDIDRKWKVRISGDALSASIQLTSALILRNLTKNLLGSEKKDKKSKIIGDKDMEVGEEEEKEKNEEEEKEEASQRNVREALQRKKIVDQFMPHVPLFTELSFQNLHISQLVAKILFYID